MRGIFFRGIQGKYEPVKNGRPISPQNQGEAELINEIREMMSDDGISP